MLRGLYRHYKGGKYIVEGIARHTESGEQLVVYRSLCDFKLWARPKEMFEESLEYQGMMVKRFTFIEDPSITAPVLTH